MAIHVSTHPLILHKVTLLRDVHTEPEKFRKVMAEISTLLTYEVTQDLPLTTRPVTSPLTHVPRGRWCATKLAFAPILRAGLGMVQGAWSVIPHAQVWHLGLKRHEATLKPTCYLEPTPSPVDSCIVLDPMLATGGTAAAALTLLKELQVPDIRYSCILAAPEGIRHLNEVHPDVDPFIGVVDERLTDEGDACPTGFIWPGIGDAGDRQFGPFPAGGSPPPAPSAIASAGANETA